MSSLLQRKPRSVEIRIKTNVAMPATLSQAVSQACIFPTATLTSLCQSIEHATSNQQTPVVQFISAYTRESVSQVAFETAVVAATLLGKKVLYIDTADQFHYGQEENAESKIHGLLAPVHNVSSALMQATGANLLPTRLCRYGDTGTTFTRMDEVKQMLEMLRSEYDMIIIASPGVLDDAFGAALAKLVDGSVLLLEAERSRAPVAIHTRDVVEGNGGKVIGAVLNKRRYYIPKWLYSWL